MLKHGLVVTFCLFTLTKSDAQIYFQNPSFEDDSVIAPCGDCTPSHWFACSQCGGLNSIWSQVSSLDSASNGNFFTDINAIDATVFDTCAQINIGQYLNCSLGAGKTYYFTLDYASLIMHPITAGFYQGHSFLQVVGSNDSCAYGETLFQQFDVDTNWHQITVIFTPTQDRSIIWLKQKPPSGESCTALIDNLSPIYCLNYNEVQALTNDTTISVGNCITLNAQTLGAFDSTYWKTVDGTIVSNALVGVQVCPTVSTEYVVCTRSTDCGNFWSYDTVRVQIPNSVATTNPFEFSLTPTLNCNAQPFHLTANSSGVLDIFDVAGQSVKRLNFGANRTDFTLDEAPSGVYFYRAVSRKKTVAGKLVLNRCE